MFFSSKGQWISRRRYISLFIESYIHNILRWLDFLILMVLFNPNLQSVIILNWYALISFRFQAQHFRDSDLS